MRLRITLTPNAIALSRTSLFLKFLLLCQLTRVFRFLRARWPGRKALAREQRKALGIENPVILLETENSETASQPALNSPRSSHVEMEEEASPRLDQSQEEASPCSPNQTESNMEYEFETA
jgi:hypothetical protein